MPKKIIVSALLCYFSITASAQTQPKFYIGPFVGGAFSRVFSGDTFAAKYSRRNHLGVTGGFSAMYDMSRSSSIIFGFNFVSKGYKLSNDTLGAGVSMLNRRIISMVIPAGLSFRQKFNSTNYIKENFGLALNYNFVKDSTTLYNTPNNATYKIVETSITKIYPMFFLGVEMGGNTENGNRYSFGLNYYQSLAKDASMKLYYGDNYAKNFGLNYRGGYLQVGFTYYFNLKTLKKPGSDYFYD